jgi:hypothetical protein
VHIKSCQLRANIKHFPSGCLTSQCLLILFYTFRSVPQCCWDTKFTLMLNSLSDIHCGHPHAEPLRLQSEEKDIKGALKTLREYKIAYYPGTEIMLLIKIFKHHSEKVSNLIRLWKKKLSRFIFWSFHFIDFNISIKVRAKEAQPHVLSFLCLFSSSHSPFSFLLSPLFLSPPLILRMVYFTNLVLQNGYLKNWIRKVKTYI